MKSLLLIGLLAAAATPQTDCQGRPMTVVKTEENVPEATRIVNFGGGAVYRVCDRGHLLYIAYTGRDDGGLGITYAGPCEEEKLPVVKLQ